MHPIVFPNVTFPTTQTLKQGKERITKPCIKQSNQHFGTIVTPSNPKFAVHVTTIQSQIIFMIISHSIGCQTPFEQKN